jgi:predicted dehydrogenase
MSGPIDTLLHIGLIGLGTTARFYLDALASSGSMRLVAVCDRDEERLRPYAGQLACFSDPSALLASGVDAVILCLPNHLHAQVAGDALCANVHVCVEKPLATSLADGEYLVRLARSSGRVLFTAFHRRYNQNVCRLRAALSGARPVRISARYLEDIREHVGNDPWYLDPTRCGGGCVADNGPNALDTLRFLFGEVQLRHARVYTDDAGVDRQAWLELETSAGVPVAVELDWAYPDGEAKDVTVWLDDGRSLRADMLAGFEGFKSSLPYEYCAILDDFERRIRSCDPHACDDGLASLTLVQAIYEASVHSRRATGVPPKRSVEGTVVKWLSHARSDRGMTLIEHDTRCVSRGELHELVTTDQRALTAGARVDRVGFLGFVEIQAAGVIERGDSVEIDGHLIGTVVGFDACHYPNHYNIIIERPALLTGRDFGPHARGRVRFASDMAASERTARTPALPSVRLSYQEDLL